MALVISCIYYARMQRWWLAGFLGGLAALTRPQGVLMVIVVGWEYWQYLGDRFAPLETQGKNIVTTFTNWLSSRILGLWRGLSAWRTLLGFTALFQITFGFVVFLLYVKWKGGPFFGSQFTERDSRCSDGQKEVRHSLIVSTFAILLSFGMVLWALGVYAVA